MQAVRGVIGESGTGWCILKEVAAAADPNDGYEDVGDVFSKTSAILSGLDDAGHFGLEALAHAVDPMHSLVLPTLDFSLTFRASEAWCTVDADGPMLVDLLSENGWFESHMKNLWLS
ncbi:hypothetical protein B0H17DRAFT_1204459 [Mycena rosella]|uniref:Uncharacterized protein n=1 Tax=Mycena rosella TaxID=1033263 RepID=A0AAD7D9M9_MYCRO|nr:hypothetical protein B0H17DRAFT_1204459 [Mycena rosella]